MVEAILGLYRQTSPHWRVCSTAHDAECGLLGVALDRRLAGQEYVGGGDIGFRLLGGRKRLPTRRAWSGGGKEILECGSMCLSWAVVEVKMLRLPPSCLPLHFLRRGVVPRTRYQMRIAAGRDVTACFAKPQTPQLLRRPSQDAKPNLSFNPDYLHSFRRAIATPNPRTSQTSSRESQPV
jgi:hypothetical protein